MNKKLNKKLYFLSFMLLSFSSYIACMENSESKKLFDLVKKNYDELDDKLDRNNINARIFDQELNCDLTPLACKIMQVHKEKNIFPEDVKTIDLLVVSGADTNFVVNNKKLLQYLVECHNHNSANKEQRTLFHKLITMFVGTDPGLYAKFKPMGYKKTDSK